MFFMLFEDIEGIMKEVEQTIEINYHRLGLYDFYEEIISYNSIFDTPHPGLVEFGDWNEINIYILNPKNSEFKLREIPQSNGNIKIAVGPYLNPKTIELKIGGVYTKKENVLVAGRVATASDDIDSLKLYKFISSKIKKKFKRIGAFYIGAKAEEKLRLGWRLVTNERLTTEFDLALES